MTWKYPLGPGHPFQVRWPYARIRGPNPDVPPPGAVQSAAFGGWNGEYLAVGCTASPFLYIYKRRGNRFTLAGPGSAPTGASRVAFSRDGVYLAVAHANPPYLTIYKRSGETFTKLPDPATLPTGNGQGIAFGYFDTFLAVAHTTTPFVSIYQRSGDVFTKLANPTGLPTGTGQRVAFTDNGNYLAVSHTTAPNFAMYSRAGNVFTKLADQAAGVIPGTANCIRFNSSDTHFAIATVFSPFLALCSHSNGVLTRLPDIVDHENAPIGNGNDIAWTRNNYLFVAHAVTPFISVWSRNGNTFTKQPALAAPPNANTAALALSWDEAYLAVCPNTSPFMAMYSSIETMKPPYIYKDGDDMIFDFDGERVVGIGA